MRFADLEEGAKCRYAGGDKVMMKFRDGRAVSEAGEQFYVDPFEEVVQVDEPDPNTEG